MLKKRPLLDEPKKNSEQYPTLEIFYLQLEPFIYKKKQKAKKFILMQKIKRNFIVTIFLFEFLLLES